MTKKANNNMEKRWFDNKVVFLPKDKPKAKEYLHEYLGISIKKA